MIPATSPYPLPISYQVRKKPQQKPSESQSQPDAVPSPVVNTAIALEYASLRYQGHCPLGMYVTPSDDSLLIWDLVLFVHQGASLRTPSIRDDLSRDRSTRLLCRLRAQVPTEISRELPGEATISALLDRRVPSFDRSAKWGVQSTR